MMQEGFCELAAGWAATAEAVFGDAKLLPAGELLSDVAEPLPMIGLPAVLVTGATEPVDVLLIVTGAAAAVTAALSVVLV